MDWLQRTGHPVLRETRDIVEAITQNRVQNVTASGTTAINPDADLVLVDATAGFIVLGPPTAALWEKRIVIIKTDASANSVAIASTPAIALTARYQSVELTCDGTRYYAVRASETTTLLGDVTGAASANTVVALQNRSLASAAPVQYQLIRSLDGSTWQPAYEGYPEAGVLTTFSLTAGNVDTTLFTVPAAPSGSGRFLLQRVHVRLTTALGGGDTGTVAVRVGTSVGGNDIGTDQTVNNASTVGTIFSGLSIATRGTAMLVANGYEAPLSAGTVISLRAATTGTISSGSCTGYVYGMFLP